jgi:hypothetical protein
MITKYLKSILLLTSLQLFLGFQCENDKPVCNNIAYSFNVTSNWFPGEDIYNINDTIFLTSTFPKTLLDNLSNQQINYNNSVPIRGIYTFYEMDSVQHALLDGVAKFDFFSANGSIIDNTSKDKYFLYEKQADNYTLKIGIIAKAKGLFAIQISNLVSNGLNGTICTGADFINILTNPNKHINLFEYAINKPPASQFEIDRIFCFRVQ